MYYATSDEMVRLDNLAVENGLEILQMMEIAGWHMLSLFRQMNIEESERVLVVCGKGNKGGDGLCCARHLSNNGFKVEVVLMEEDVGSNSRHHLSLLKKMNISINFYNKYNFESITKKIGVIIDALIGYRLKGSPRGNYGKVVNKVNSGKKRVISYDIPTGIDSSTGECNEPYINADATLTLGLPKKAFTIERVKKASGKLFLGDIGIPAVVYDKIKKGSRPEFEDEMGLMEI